MTTPDRILSFWFGDLPDDAACAAGQAALWWQKDERTDCHIAAHFGESLDIAATGGMDAWRDTPRTRVALIILLDQFSRNIYRGTRRSFAQDTQALRLCEEGLDRGHDRELRAIHRVFFYLPLEHAESMDAQRRSVGLFEALRDDAPQSQRKPFDGFVDYARKHMAVIEMFGRFPHRNAILGRESTTAELEYLSQPDAGF